MVTTETMPLLNTWLGQVGFSRGNPFATTEADRESALPEYFVDTGEYEIIKGRPDQPQTVLVFAPRGGGKSAHRVMLASQCRPRNKDGTILAIVHVEFDPLLRAELTPPQVVDGHIALILRHGCTAALQACLSDADLVSRIAPALRGRLRFFCELFHPDLLSASRLQELFEQIKLPQVYADWPAFQRATRPCRPPMGYSLPRSTAGLSALLNQHGVTHPGAHLLADLLEGPSEAVDFVSMPAAFKAFVDMIRALGFDALYVLVDRVDELPDTANDPQRAVALIQPLVAHLPLMETPGAAFKFFLPAHLDAHLSGAIRADRLPISRIEWDENRLRRLLEERLTAYSEGKITSLAQISAPQLGDIDGKLIRCANCSPRQLLVQGNALLLAHCRRPQLTDLLTVDDWSAVYGQAARVRVSRNGQLVFVEGEPRSLTSLEYRFLASLLEHNGACDKETLADEVWGSTEGVSDQAISRLVLRLRQKIEANPARPQHLVTDRGRGFRLAGVEWND